MAKPIISMIPGVALRISYPRVFRDSVHGSRELFLKCTFAVGEVISVEIDEQSGCALVHLRPGLPAIVEPLKDLAEKLVSPLEAVRGVENYFELKREGTWVSYARAPQRLSGIGRWFYQGLGFGFLGLSIMGVASPFVPTTPFVLLSSYFFVRSSPAINAWLLQNRLFGPILRDWYIHHALRRSVRRKMLIIGVLVFALTIALAGPTSPALPMMLLVSLFSFGFVMQLPVVDDNRLEKPAAGPSRLPSLRTAPLQLAPCRNEHGG